MSSQPYQLRTRSSYSTAHPGLVDRGTARRSPSEVAQAKKDKEDAKQEKAKQEKLVKASKAKRIAELEQDIDEDDALDATPRPQLRKANTL